MRKDREENLDYLDEEDTGIEDERQGFSTISSSGREPCWGN